MMKPYPLVDDLLRPLLGVAMPRARRLYAPGGDEELFPGLRTFKQLDPERCPVPFLVIPAGPPSAPWGAQPSWRPTSPGAVVGQELKPCPRRIKRFSPK